MGQKVRTEIVPFSHGLVSTRNRLTIDKRGFWDFSDYAISGEIQDCVVQVNPATEFWTPEGGVTLVTVFSGVDAAGSKYIYATGGTKVYQKIVGGAAATVKTGLTSGKTFSVATMNNPSGTPTAYFFNGTDTPFQATIAGSPTVTDIGLTRPTVTNATTALNGAGNVRGTVKYYIASISGTTEGALSAAFGEIDAETATGGSKVDVDLTHGDFGSTWYRLYRTAANREEPRFVTAIQGGTTHTDDKRDRGLGDVPFLHGDPPPTTSSLAISYLNRLWVVDKNKVYFSDVGQPESFFTTSNGNYFTVGPEDGQNVVALAVDNLGLVIFKSNHIYRLVGEKIDEFRLYDISGYSPQSEALGTDDPDTVVPTSRGIMFSKGNSIYTLQGNQVFLFFRFSDEGGYRTPDVSFTTIAYAPKFDSIYTGDCYILDLNKPDSWAAHYSQGFIWSTTVGGQVYGCSGEDVFSYPIRYWESDAGNEWKDNATTPTPSFSLKTVPFYGGDPLSLKRFLWVDLILQVQRNISFSVTPRVHNSNLTAITGITPYDQNSGSGAAINDLQVLRVPINSEGYDLQLTISNDVEENPPPGDGIDDYHNIRYLGAKYAWVDMPNTLPGDSDT